MKYAKFACIPTVDSGYMFARSNRPDLVVELIRVVEHVDVRVKACCVGMTG